MPEFDFSTLRPPALMGIVNITPNSFSDGGQFYDPAAAVMQAQELVKAGAQILDLGAEASSFFRAGVTPIDPPEQLRRLLPVLEKVRGLSEAIVSVDTRSAVVAREVLAGGAHMVNDISAGMHDAEMLPTVAAEAGAIVLMHIGANYPEPATCDDTDIVEKVSSYLEERIAAAVAAGIPPTKIAIDPGIGFGKSMADNWRLALRCDEFSRLGVPVVLGASRKRFLDTPLPAGLPPISPLHNDLLQHSTHPRDAATAALTAYAARRAVPIHRIHNVTLARMALTM